MQDRVPRYPGRVTLTPVSGQPNTFDLVRADQPVTVGDPLNKATLLSDQTAALLGLGASAVPDDALYRLALLGVSFLTASWSTIQDICNLGLASTAFKIGDTKNIVLTTGETITVRIEDFDHDDLTAGGKAAMTLGMVNCLNATRRMNASSVNAGGWGNSAMRTWMSTFINQLPADLRAVIKQVNKKTSAGSQSSAINTTADKLWLFSYTEVGFPNDSSYSPGNSSEGAAYPLFVADASRVKNVNGSAAGWWLRSPSLGSTVSFCLVFSDGARTNGAASSSYGVAAGFCI